MKLETTDGPTYHFSTGIIFNIRCVSVRECVRACVRVANQVTARRDQASCSLTSVKSEDLGLRMQQK